MALYRFSVTNSFHDTVRGYCMKKRILAVAVGLLVLIAMIRREYVRRSEPGLEAPF